MENKPEISVVMPAYNAEEYVTEAIESILNQTFTDFEFIVVNDASTDKTLDIITAFAQKDKRIKIINNQKNLYIAGALNKGIEAAQGKYIARMDADDVSMPNRLQSQYDLLEQDSGIAVAGGNILLIDKNGKDIGYRTYPATNKELKARMFKHSPFAHPTTMYRRDVFNEFGGYNPVWSPSEDIDLWFKIGSKYKFASVPEYIFKYRYFSDSSSNKKIRHVELITLQMRYNAMRILGYKPGLTDIIFNILQFVTLWIIPAKVRMQMFNLIRNKIYK